MRYTPPLATDNKSCGLAPCMTMQLSEDSPDVILLTSKRQYVV